MEYNDTNLSQSYTNIFKRYSSRDFAFEKYEQGSRSGSEQSGNKQ